MDAQELATILNGREYRQEVTVADERVAKDNFLVIVFGASDDLMEFRGAIDDEVGCYNNGTAYLTPGGLLTNECDNDGCPHFKRLKKAAAKIHPVWDTGGYSWIFKTEIPHATFDIVEDGEKYCRGIVFRLSDVVSS